MKKSLKEVNAKLSKQIRSVGLSLARDAEDISGNIPYRTGEFVIKITFTDESLPVIESTVHFLPSETIDRIKW